MHERREGVLNKPLSSGHGTYKTVEARFWPWLSGDLQIKSWIFKLFPLRSRAVPDNELAQRDVGVVRRALRRRPAGDCSLNYYANTSILLADIVMCSKFHNDNVSNSISIHIRAFLS